MSLKNKFLNFGKLYSIFIAVVGTILGLLLLAAGIDKLKNKNHNNNKNTKNDSKNGIILLIIGLVAIFGSWFMAWLAFHSDKYASSSAYNAIFNLFSNK